MARRKSGKRLRFAIDRRKPLVRDDIRFRRRRFGRRLGGSAFVPEFRGGLQQLSAQDSDASWRLNGQSYPVSGDSPNLDYDVVADVYPFSDFST